MTVFEVVYVIELVVTVGVFLATICLTTKKKTD